MPPPPIFAAIEPSGRLAQLLAYWQGLKPDGLPRRTDIDLMEMSPALLPHVFLVDVLEDRQRFRWRLIGAHIIRQAGTDDTGLDLEISIAPSMRPIILGHYRQVVEERRPLCHRGEFIGSDQRVTCGGVFGPRSA